ncbi:hypothetical protein V8G54_027286 [Vigna mungo]|uniref:Uncharacterized protein n=1 Tax=Vigna mungo TaxID=3915 RepID=A0AAQ3RNY2_VIGMU
MYPSISFHLRVYLDNTDCKNSRHASEQPFYIEKHIHTPNTCSIKKFTEKILNTQHVNKHIKSYFKRRLHEILNFAQDILITGNRTRGIVYQNLSSSQKQFYIKYIPNNPQYRNLTII